MRRGGFLAGAVGGLALALLLVGVASFLPQTNNPLNTATTPQGSAQPVTTLATKASTMSSTTNGSAQFIAGLPGAQIAGVAAGAVPFPA